MKIIVLLCCALSADIVRREKPVIEKYIVLLLIIFSLAFFSPGYAEEPSQVVTQNPYKNRQGVTEVPAVTVAAEEASTTIAKITTTATLAAAEVSSAPDATEGAGTAGDVSHKEQRVSLSLPDHTAQLCQAWRPSMSQLEPPIPFTRCTRDEECGEVRSRGCCRSFRVAVQKAHMSCIARQNGSAHCRARCRPQPANYREPIVSPACVEGHCRFRFDSRESPQVIVVPGPR